MYENEPMETGTMQRPPRKMGATFLSFKQLSISIFQGIMIATACLGIGYYYMLQGENETMVRTIIFITLLFSNILLTLINRSFQHSLITTIRYKNKLVPLIIGIVLLLIILILNISFINNLFQLVPLSLNNLSVCILLAMIGTLWMEGWKILKLKIKR
jgi:Ca2+-transporting ATPase